MEAYELKHTAEAIGYYSGTTNPYEQTGTTNEKRI